MHAHLCTVHHHVGLSLPAAFCLVCLKCTVGQFFTSYNDPVTLEPIAHRKSICQRYMRGWFWIDAISVFPTNYIVKVTPSLALANSEPLASR